MSRGEGCVWSRGSHETQGAASAPGIQRPTTGQLSSSPLKPPQTHGQEGPRGQDNTKAQIRKSKPGGEASSGRRAPKCRPLVEGFAVHCAQGGPPVSSEPHHLACGPRVTCSAFCLPWAGQGQAPHLPHSASTLCLAHSRRSCNISGKRRELFQSGEAGLAADQEVGLERGSCGSQRGGFPGGASGLERSCLPAAHAGSAGRVCPPSACPHPAGTHGTPCPRPSDSGGKDCT